MIVLAIMGVIFAFSAQSIRQSEDLSESVAEELLTAQEEQYTQVPDREILFGFTLRKLAHGFLYALLGFSLYYVFAGIRARFPLAVGAAFCCGILVELYQAKAAGIGRWQDTLIDLVGILIGAGLALLIPVLLKRIKKWYKKREEHRRLEQILDALSLAAVLHYAVFRFLQSTMFRFHYSDRYKTVTILLLILFGGIRFLYLALKKCWAADSAKEQSFFFLRCLFAFCLAVPFVLVGWMHDYKVLIFLPICCLCLYDMKLEKVCRAFLFTIGTCLAALILCCLCGTVPQIVNPEKNFSGSFGAINSTDFASYFTFLLLIAWCCTRMLRWYTKLLFAALSSAVIYYVYTLTDSRTSLYIGGLFVLAVLWDCLNEHVFSRVKWLGSFGKGVNWLSILAFPAVGALVVFLTARFAAQDPWALELEKTLSGRLITVLQPFQMYGIKPFGNTIERMYGQGGTILGSFWSSGYSYLDVAYAMLAIRFGWVVTGIVAGFWLYTTVKALRTGKTRFAWAMFILACHGFSEARILDVNYNIFLIIPFCAFTAESNTDSQTQESNRVFLIRLLTGTALAGIFSLILPTAISWLRTFFYLKNWNEGTSAFASFLFFAAAFLLTCALWKNVNMLWENRNKKTLLPLAGILLLLFGSVLIVNGTIEHGRTEQADRILTEKALIHRLQETASLPIYAAESEELYRREGIAVADHWFTTEELGRTQGSMLADRNIEAFGITTSGGRYAQISEKTGLYSYDPNVIAALANDGYPLSLFYTGKRHVALHDLARFNDMRPADHLILNNSMRVITKNMETDQIGGAYEVSFKFSDFVSEAEGEAVVLEVLGEMEDHVLYRETLTAADFDSEGTCAHTLAYQINSTPQVSYAISVKEGVSVTVEDIAWQRVNLADRNQPSNLLFFPENPQIGASDYSNGVWRSASGGTGERTIVDIQDAPIPGVHRAMHITGKEDSVHCTDLAIDHVPLLLGNTYTLSVYAKGSGQLHLEHGRTSWDFVSYDVSGEWERYSYTFTVGDQDGAVPDAPWVSIYVGSMPQLESDIYICNVCLEDITVLGRQQL